MCVKYVSETCILENEPANQRKQKQHKSDNARHIKTTQKILRPLAAKSRLRTCTEHNMISGVVKPVLLAPNLPTTMQPEVLVNIHLKIYK